MYACIILPEPEGKTGVPGGEPLRAEKEPTTNLAHIWSVLRIEPSPHRWEASALTTAPALLPSEFADVKIYFSVAWNIQFDSTQIPSSGSCELHKL